MFLLCKSWRHRLSVVFLTAGRGLVLVMQIWTLSKQIQRKNVVPALYGAIGAKLRTLGLIRFRFLTQRAVIKGNIASKLDYILCLLHSLYNWQIEVLRYMKSYRSSSLIHENANGGWVILIRPRWIYGPIRGPIIIGLLIINKATRFVLSQAPNLNFILFKGRINSKSQKV